jgi:hypothetical protein
VNEYRSIASLYTWGEGIGLCGEHTQGYTLQYVFDQIPNLQNSFTTPNKNLGGRGPLTDKHLPPSIFTGQSVHLELGVFIDILSMFCTQKRESIPIQEVETTARAYSSRKEPKIILI